MSDYDVSFPERAILASTGASFCPSKVAQSLDVEDWRVWMAPIRAAALPS